ncbi:MAG TPA: hypothetical protein VM308_05255 [Sphingomicrobium sp.]|nr:hypothetical protein [Sphingomicrobium sp.]
MTMRFVTRLALGLSTAALPGVALAQAGWTPGSEIVGQPIQVTTNGTTNTLVLNPGGSASISTPGGNVVPASWQAANGQLCLSASGATECVPYNNPFQAQQARNLTSSCGTMQTWLAQATNQGPTRSQRGERGN